MSTTEEFESTINDIKSDLIERRDLKTQEAYLQVAKDRLDVVLEHLSESTKTKLTIQYKQTDLDVLNFEDTFLDKAKHFVLDDLTIKNKITPLLSSMVSCLIDSTILQNDEASLLQKWISTGNSSFELVYRGSRDGFTAAAFHQKCDKHQPTVTIMKSKEYGKVFGGFSNENWKQLENIGHYKKAKSFVFSISERTKYDVKPQYKDKETVCCNNKYMTCFGQDGCDIAIQHDCNRNSNSGIFGRTYENRGKSLKDIAGAEKFYLEEIEVFCVKFNGNLRA